MDLEKVFSLIDKAEKSEFDKIKIKMDDISLTLERNGEKALAAAPAAMVLETTPAAKQLAEEKLKESIELSADDTVFAPISGVFYIAREPGEEAFVTEGNKVKKGDTLCIIEAMKTMNEISAPRSGVIESILKQDSDQVMAGEPLFSYAEGK